MRVLIFGGGFKRGFFYFIPTFKHEWGPCGCWKVSFIMGNFSLDVWTTCDPEYIKNLSGE